MIIPIKSTFKQQSFLTDFIAFRCILAMEYEFLTNLNISLIAELIGKSSLKFSASVSFFELNITPMPLVPKT